tara:strand:- start:8 stop:409 length:402 start_codon:yes stop_codon:yes gene_type:complete
MAAAAQLSILVAAGTDSTDYNSVVDTAHWLFAATVGLICCFGVHWAALLYAFSILLLTLGLRWVRRRQGAIPCPFEEIAPSNIPNLGPYAFDVVYGGLATVGAVRLLTCASTPVGGSAASPSLPFPRRPAPFQ